VYSLIRSDYVGWEIDRFFRLTKASIKGGVLIGPEVLSYFKKNNLLESTEIESQRQGEWVISRARIKICCGPDSYTSLGENYMLARRFLTAKEQKGVGAGCNIGVVYFKYQENIEFNTALGESNLLISVMKIYAKLKAVFKRLTMAFKRME
jgi:hypothetical protein